MSSCDLSPSKIAPQRNVFKEIMRCKKLNHWLTLLAIVLSCFIGIFQSSDKYTYFPSLVNFLGITYAFITAVHFFVSVYTEFFLFPDANDVRRCDLLDNSLEAKFGPIPSQNYYTNIQTPSGLKRLSVNCFESSLFSSEITERMLLKSSIISLLMFGALIYVMSYGIKDNAFYMIVFPLFFSGTVIGETIKLFLFHSRVKTIFQRFTQFFANNNNQDFTSCHAEVIKLILDYECTISWANILLDSKIYDSLNPQVSEKWNRVKSRYKL